MCCRGVRYGDEVNARVSSGGRAHAKESLLGERAAAVPEEGYYCWFVVAAGKDKLRRGWSMGTTGGEGREWDGWRCEPGEELGVEGGEDGGEVGLRGGLGGHCGRN